MKIQCIKGVVIKNNIEISSEFAEIEIKISEKRLIFPQKYEQKSENCFHSLEIEVFNRLLDIFVKRYLRHVFRE